MIEKKLYAHLIDSCPSLSGRIYPLHLRDDNNYPCLVYRTITNKDVETLGCSIGSVVRLQLDIFDVSYAKSVLARDEVKNALQSFEYKPREIYTHEVYEDQLELYRQIVDFVVNF